MLQSKIWAAGPALLEIASELATERYNGLGHSSMLLWHSVMYAWVLRQPESISVHFASLI